MGFFSDLAREDYDRSYTDWALVRRLADYFKRHGKKLTITLVATLIAAGAAASSPVLVAYGVGLLDQNLQDLAAVLDCTGSLRAWSHSLDGKLGAQTRSHKGDR